MNHIYGYRYQKNGKIVGSALDALLMPTILLLLLSNIFMTFAWYGHLKFKTSPLWTVILVSWGIAFFEYCFQVPANRMGHGTFTAAQLKTMQEVITLVVFCGFSVFYLKEELKWNVVAGFACLIGAVFFVFKKW
ncbi:MAG: DMT family protein [Candidatus Nitrotoga sp.]